MTDLADLSTADLTKAFKARTLSPVEATKAALKRIEACEPKLNAMYIVSADQALKAARAAEKRYAKGEPLSVIDGVPSTIKDNMATAGDPCPVGVPIADMTPRAVDSPVSARMREAGAVILGKTTMPDYGMLSAGVSSLHGVTRNPWNTTRNTAGSSSGAGAAGAAGYGPLHIGTDIGGSIRLPAAHCGLFGLKPSLGRVPLYPPYLGRVAGPMTRTVKDSALLMNVITGPDFRDHMSLPYQPVDYAKGLSKLKVKGLKIGLLTEMPSGLPADPAIIKAVKAAAKALEAEGAHVEVLKGFVTPSMLDGISCFFEQRSYNDISKLPAAQKKKLLPYIVDWATWRAKDFTGADVMRFYGEVVAMREAAVLATQPFDFVIQPCTCPVSYPAEHHSPTNDYKTALEHIPFTVAYNFSEQPAASLNWTYHSDGMPIGVQVSGRRFDDIGVMRMSRVLEQLRPEQKAWPLG
ncbi:amidase [Phreatobacter aquaticus]|uniref:Amidase n=1 Tax=Phreatobacter aquaticus TaxID=2570229 RepID=A0A4D7QQ24_9HYPH|nr:amidase [Phreatobacter aquaticus]QCK87726.1 amidase [Phreatobacter aquaticus]